ncbi:MAG: hypothetical protein GF364_02980, partial [Candidatus Lokiarchaeota archaeon]|nr:hypothetical protein [Candidatus Lokiarchaeota archaeon]
MKKDKNMNQKQKRKAALCLIGFIIVSFLPMMSNFVFNISSINRLSPESADVSQAGRILISEVKFKGTGAEWIEIFNNNSGTVQLSGCSLYSYGYDNETNLDSVQLSAYETYVVGELPTAVDQVENISLRDVGDVLVLRNSLDEKIDVVVWGTGNETYSYGLDSGWIDENNVTVESEPNSSIFRYNITSELLADTNSSADWYSTNELTLDGFYELKTGDLLISEVGIEMDSYYDFAEIYNNLTWPVLVKNLVLGTDATDSDLTITSDLLIPARDVIVVGDSSSANIDFDFEETISYYNDGYVRIYDSVSGVEYDAMCYGDGLDYPGDGWESAINVTDPGTWDNETTVQRYRTESGGLQDTNKTEDWFTTAKNLWELPAYIPPVIDEQKLLISEVMYGGTGIEWVEIFNNDSESIDIENVELYCSFSDQTVLIDESTLIEPHSTYIIGELPSQVDKTINITLNDNGDVLILKNSSGNNIDVVVWGIGHSSFIPATQNGWINSNNCTGNLNEGTSIFRYNMTSLSLADTNSSSDWYATDEPTLGAFYQLQPNDILISEVGIHMDTGYDFVEIYNNKTWPVLARNFIVGTDMSDADLTINADLLIPARGVIVVGDDDSTNADYDYEEEMSLYNTDGYVRIYSGITNIEYDAICYGDGLDYPGGGWDSSVNITGAGNWDNDTTIQRINGTNGELIDNNLTSDWGILPKTLGYIQEIIKPGSPGDILITEIMPYPDSPVTGHEYLELYNPSSSPITLNNWSIHRTSTWGGDPEISLPFGLIIPAKTHITILDDNDLCFTRYGSMGLNYTPAGGFTLDDGPGEVLLIDSYTTIIDRVAWSYGDNEFEETIDSTSWEGDGIYKTYSGRVLARVYDPTNKENYVDTNTKEEWRNYVYPSPGIHTNNVYFLSTPVVGSGTVTTFSSPDNSFAAITSLIDSAKSSLDICVYQFTSYYLLQSLISAMDRGVQVRLILEDIYPLHDSPYLEDSTHDDENYEVVYVASQVDNHENGSVRWENEDYFTYTHAKYFIIDEEVTVICTENFKFTGIPKDSSAGNRGWGIAVNN